MTWKIFQTKAIENNHFTCSPLFWSPLQFLRKLNRNEWRSQNCYDVHAIWDLYSTISNDLPNMQVTITEVSYSFILYIISVLMFFLCAIWKCISKMNLLVFLFEIVVFVRIRKLSTKRHNYRAKVSELLQSAYNS